MRKWLMLIWIILPVAALSLHYGPGQRWLQRDSAQRSIDAARAAEQNEQWGVAMTAYEAAIAAAPESDHNLRYQLRLSHARAQMYGGGLPEAMFATETLLEDIKADKTGDPALQTEIRTQLAQMHYYVTWMMRLEGASTEEWTPEIEEARQHFRLLAETADADSPELAEYQKNLEATIRLARMDLSELKGLPLPKECQGSGNCSGKCKAQRESRTRVKKKGSDVRQEISESKNNGAGMNGRSGGGS